MILFYLTPVLIFFVWQQIRSRLKSTQNSNILKENAETGLDTPSSLHPLINDSLCIGCNSCIAACPEGEVLGLIKGKAQLIHPTNCIGHGACARACPVGGISLVFGSARRGVDIPLVDSTFETNVSGVYLAGEIGGMGLVKNAMTQGVQAIENIKQRRTQMDYPYDVFIVGAGPAGIAATISAKHFGLKYRTIEQDSFGGTVAHFPRAKLVMTQAVELPGVGKLKIGEIQKEELLEKWQNLKEQTQIEVSYEERLESVTPLDPGFSIKTNKGEYQSNTLLLAIGRRGTPRKLEVKGEDLSKVVYRLVDSSQYKGMCVLVVGGGDSAVEAAMAIADEPDTQVTLSYRGDAFNRIKPKNRQRLEKMGKNSQLDIRLNSSIVEIRPKSVILNHGDQKAEIQNDAVIVNAGGILPTPLLKAIGIEIETKYGTI